MTSTCIRELNDAFRQQGPFFGGRWFMTAGVQAGGPAFFTQAIQAVRSFDSFTRDNDPYGEHDFGSFTVGTQKLLWKIDYYDQTMTYGSDDPANPDVTTRVMTIMLASEY